MTDNTINVHEEVASALPAVLERMRGELANRIAAEAQSVAIEEVRKAARDWALENLVPEIKAQLEAGKEGFVAQAETLSKTIAAEIVKALTAKVQENLKHSWKLSDVTKGLFG